MRRVRHAIVAAAVALCACAPEFPSDCFARQTETTACFVPDGGLNFSPDTTRDELESICSAACVDVSHPVAITGYDDLRGVPGLSKLRRVGLLMIDVSRLPDLRGLEEVDVQMLMLRANQETRPKTFGSLSGLGDTELQSLSIDYVEGLSSLSSANLQKVSTLTLIEVGVTELPISELQVEHLNVEFATQLTSVTLGATPMQQVQLNGNPMLKALNWSPGLSVKHSITINHNALLSTCDVNRFVAETDTSKRALVHIGNNGPCP